MADCFTEHTKIYYDSIITVYIAMCCTFLQRGLQNVKNKKKLLLDLQHARFLVDLVTIEVSCLGHFTPVTVTRLSNVCHLPKSTIIIL